MEVIQDNRTEAHILISILICTLCKNRTYDLFSKNIGPLAHLLFLMVFLCPHAQGVFHDDVSNGYRRVWNG